jgi:ketosteroid isomerase-like protein
MRDEERVLAANAAFYHAFAAKDARAMEAVWAARAPIACVHPGWQALRGREAVLSSWRAILSGSSAPSISSSGAVAQVFGDTAFVICTEHIPNVELIATNVFVREQGEWKMVHHHASGVVRPSAPAEDEDEPSGGGMLH